MEIPRFEARGIEAVDVMTDKKNWRARVREKTTSKRFTWLRSGGRVSPSSTFCQLCGRAIPGKTGWVGGALEAIGAGPWWPLVSACVIGAVSGNLQAA